MNKQIRNVAATVILLLAMIGGTILSPIGAGAQSACPSHAEMELSASYRMVFDRAPDPAGLAFWLENFDAYPAGHLNSAEPSTSNVSEWYENLYGRSPSSRAVAYWASVPRAAALRGIAASDEAVELYAARSGCSLDAVPNEPTAVLSIEDAIRATFPESPNVAVAVAWCESRHKLDAVGPDGNDLGLFQVRWTVHHRLLTANGISRSDLFTLEGNLKAARLVYDESTTFRSNAWNAWVCYGLI